MLASWYMSKNDDVVDQFSKNYLGDVNLNEFCKNTGIEYYTVNCHLVNQTGFDFSIWFK
jgi:hypothetical protein